MAGVKGKSGGVRKGAGRPQHKRTADNIAHIEKMAALGASVDLMSDILKIPVSTIYASYDKEIKLGREKMLLRVGEGVLERALGGDNACALFLLRTRGKEVYSERQEVTGKDGGAIQSAVSLTNAEFTATAKKLLKEV